MSTEIETVRSSGELRRRLGSWRAAGERIGLVATMGALHRGHLSLVEIAKGSADRVVVSVFVNPKQFGPNEDLESYPRDEARDLAKLAELGADLVYAPRSEGIYPPGFATRVEVGGLSEGLCANSRPQFFSGVATVVLKLFLQCRPEVAVFGEKDYQQLLVVRRMACDLELGVEVLAAPTVREPDGLAMSSRNAYLGPDERRIAPLLHRTIETVAREVAGGGDIEKALRAGRERLSTGGFEVDYLEVRDGATLAPLTGLVGVPARVFGAANLGQTRLIDNVEITR